MSTSSLSQTPKLSVPNVKSPQNFKIEKIFFLIAMLSFNIFCEMQCKSLKLIALVLSQGEGGSYTIIILKKKKFLYTLHKEIAK